MSEKKHWIQDAVKKPGAMSKAAKREGVSNSSYIQEHQHNSGKSGQRSRFAKIMSELRKK